MTRLRGRSVAWLTVAGMITVVAFLVIAATDRDASVPSDGVPDGANLQEELTGFTSTLRADAPYRAPDANESRVLAQAVGRLGEGDPAAVHGIADEVRPLGYSTRIGTDAQTGRSFVLVANEQDSERGWGLYVVDLSRPARVVVEVPHPVSDLRTEEIGLALFRRMPGAVLAVAGTHRRAANGAGDVAHREDSMFHAVAKNLAEQGLPQVQLHGFADTSLPGVDVVLSPGASQMTTALRTASSGLADAGLDVCEAWTDDCAGLEGRRNKQGITAAELGARFVHVEINRTVRDDPDRWSEVVRVLGAAEFSGG